MFNNFAIWLLNTIRKWLENNFPRNWKFHLLRIINLFYAHFDIWGEKQMDYFLFCAGRRVKLSQIVMLWKIKTTTFNCPVIKSFFFEKKIKDISERVFLSCLFCFSWNVRQFQKKTYFCFSPTCIKPSFEYERKFIALH